MKWLSMIFTLNLVIAMLSIAAVADASVDLMLDGGAPKSIEDACEIYGDIYEDFKLACFHCDECALNGAVVHGGGAIMAPAFGRFSSEGGDGYATSWDIVVANSGVCKDSTGNIITHFYLIGDTNTAGTMDFGRTGRALTIDGSLGEAKINRNYRISNSLTLFVINGGPNTRVVFKDVILETTNSTCAIKVPTESGSRVGGSLILGDGVEIYSNSVGILVEETDFSVEINGAIINTSSEAISVSGARSTVCINSGEFALCDVNENDAALNKNSITGDIPTAKRILYTSNGSVNIYGGNFYIYESELDCDDKTLSGFGAHALSYGNGKVNIFGGNFYGGQYLVFQAGFDAYDDVFDKYAMPVDSNCKLSGLYTKEGAAVRTVAGSSGIRFEGGIEADYVDYVRDYLAKSNDDFYIGIAIAPQSAVDEVGGFAFSLLAPDKYVTTKADKGLIYNDDNTYTLRLSLVGIREYNYSRDFVAIAYIGFESDEIDGLSADDTIFYASTTSGARSIEYVAKVALADVKEAQGEYNGVNYSTLVNDYYFARTDDGYVRVEIEDGVVKYSKYTEAQLGILKLYIKS